MGSAGVRNEVFGRVLNFVHFNDCYNIEEFATEPVGGASRLVGKVKSLAEYNPLVVFSGDIYNPSLLSTVTKGRQMVHIMNRLGVAAACLGNHDFDFGVENAQALNQLCHFPWLCSNALDVNTGEPLAGAQRWLLLEHGGVRVGLMGLLESEWLQTLATMDADQVHYSDFVEAARETAQILRAEGADLVVALTHMRWPNDERLAREVPEVDLVLGGHDHDSQKLCVQPHGTWVIKSGTDFKELTLLEVTMPGSVDERVKVVPKGVRITKECPEDAETTQLVEGYMADMAAQMSRVIGHTAVDLDGRFSTVRLSESNLGNLVCDVWRAATSTDCALLNSGTLRSDRIHAAGPLRLQDLFAILPYLDQTVTLRIRGAQLLKALENSVSLYPRLEGRFPQVSGLSFTFDPSNPAGERIVPGSVRVGDDLEALEVEKSYLLATKDYLYQGKDGFDVFQECEVVVDADLSPFLPTLLRNFFSMMDVINEFDRKQALVYKAAMKAKRVLNRQFSKPSYGLAVRSKETGAYQTAPALEGRIVCATE